MTKPKKSNKVNDVPNNRKFLISFVLIFSTVILLVIGVFVYNFWKNPFSKSPIDWGASADFLGGMINPIVGVANVIVLGYLTLIVSRYSSNESKKLIIYQAKKEAYEELMKFTRNVRNLPNELGLFNLELGIMIECGGDDAKKLKSDIFNLYIQIIHSMSQLTSDLFMFREKYSYLLNYDFNCKEYRELVEEYSQIKQFVINEYLTDVSIDSMKLSFKSIMEITGKTLNSNLDSFSNSISSELLNNL